MYFRTTGRQILIFVLFAGLLTGCASVQIEPTMTSTAAIPETSIRSPTPTTHSTLAPQPSSPTPSLSAYAFPDAIDPAKEYLFYLHGKIIEDQGIPAISPELWRI